MLTLLVCDCENLEQLLPHRDWLALVADSLFPLCAPDLSELQRLSEEDSSTHIGDLRVIGQELEHFLHPKPTQSLVGENGA